MMRFRMDDAHDLRRGAYGVHHRPSCRARGNLRRRGSVRPCCCAVVLPSLVLPYRISSRLAMRATTRCLGAPRPLPTRHRGEASASARVATVRSAPSRGDSSAIRCIRQFSVECSERPTLWSLCGHSVVTLWSLCGHSVVILCSLCAHSVLTLRSLCAHSVLILCSLCAHSALIRNP